MGHKTISDAFDSVIDNANCSSIVESWCLRLWMSEFVQGKAKDFGSLGIEEEGS
jgi:hypothetical protein